MPSNRRLLSPPGRTGSLARGSFFFGKHQRPLRRGPEVKHEKRLLSNALSGFDSIFLFTVSQQRNVPYTQEGQRAEREGGIRKSTATVLSLVSNLASVRTANSTTAT